MKKLIMFVVMIAAVGSFCFAQQAPVAVKQEAKPQTQSKSAVGKIESITIADAAKDIKSELIVVEEDGTKVKLMPAGTVKILDVDMNTITLDKLAKDQKVRVKYHTTDAGVNEATSIKLLK